MTLPNTIVVTEMMKKKKTESPAGKGGSEEFRYVTTLLATGLAFGFLKILRINPAADFSYCNIRFTFRFPVFAQWSSDG